MRSSRKSAAGPGRTACGRTWTALNTYLISKSVASVCTIDTTLFTGPSGYGAFFSSDAGQTWHPSGKGLFE